LSRGELSLVCTIYRILVRKPSIIVDSEGIIDQCSLIAGGLGLIGWDEIKNIALYAYRPVRIQNESQVFLRDNA
jgi:hypothetical protein